MRRLAAALAVALAAVGGAAAATATEKEPEPCAAPVKARAQIRDRAPHWTLPIPGQITSIAFRRAARGGAQDAPGTGREIYLLATPRPSYEPAGRAFPPAERPCGREEWPDTPMLYRVRLASPPVLEIVRAGLGERARALLALDLDGDGAEELLLEEDGALKRLDLEAAGGAGGASDAVLFTDRDLDLANEDPPNVRFPSEPPAVRHPLTSDEEEVRRRRVASPRLVPRAGGNDGAPFVRVTALGELRIWRPDGSSTDGREWSVTDRVPLRTRVVASPTSLVFASPQVRRLGEDEREILLASGPVPYGDERLKTLLLRRVEGKLGVEEIWSRLPNRDEWVNSSGYLIIDGEPHLWVETDRKMEMEFFGDHGAFRLFRLGTDRSGAGVLPVLRLDDIDRDWEWGRAPIKAAFDGDGDGRQDLMIIESREKLRSLLHVRRADGTFDPSPHSRELEPGYGLACCADQDGDGRPDLVAADASRVRIHPLAGAPGGRDLVSPPRLVAPLSFPASEDAAEVDCGPGRVFDLEGDGRPEWLCAAVDPDGRPYLSIATFAPPSSEPQGRGKKRR